MGTDVAVGITTSRCKDLDILLEAFGDIVE
jgi:hypothetical protein